MPGIINTLLPSILCCALIVPSTLGPPASIMCLAILYLYVQTQTRYYIWSDANMFGMNNCKILLFINIICILYTVYISAAKEKGHLRFFIQSSISGRPPKSGSMIDVAAYQYIMAGHQSSGLMYSNQPFWLTTYWALNYNKPENYLDTID